MLGPWRGALGEGKGPWRSIRGWRQTSLLGDQVFSPGDQAFLLGSESKVRWLEQGSCEVDAFRVRALEPPKMVVE